VVWFFVFALSDSYMHGHSEDDEDVVPQTEREGKGGSTIGALNNMIKPFVGGA
jgi:hypothetical protein